MLESGHIKMKIKRIVISPTWVDVSWIKGADLH